MCFENLPEHRSCAVAAAEHYCRPAAVVGVRIVLPERPSVRRSRAPAAPRRSVRSAG